MKYKANHLKGVYKKGYNAAIEGTPKEKNPYRSKWGRKMSQFELTFVKVWNEGWDDAKKRLRGEIYD